MIFSADWRKFLRRNREGWIRLTPEDSDDIWALYNIIAPGDEVEAMTMRRVVQENAAGNVVDSQKIKVLLAVRAEKVDVDIKGASLRVNGKNIRENKHVKLGSYHTLDLEPGRDVKISKASWDQVALEFLESSAASAKAEIGAIQLAEGLAFVCQVNPTGVKILERVEVAMPKKKLGSTSALEKAQEKFNVALGQAALAHLNWARLRAVVIAAPGKEDSFHRWFLDWLQKAERKDILEHKQKLLRVSLPGTTLNPHALLEVLKEPRIAALLQDTRGAIEAKLMDQLQKQLANTPDRCTYGLKHVAHAAKECAIKHLLLADSLFRTADVEERKRMGRLISEVKENSGGQVTIFSPDGPPAAELDKLAGIAALLNFPLDFD